MVDQLLDPQELIKARKAQLKKFWQGGAFTPLHIHKAQIPQGWQIFSHKRVDKCSRGIYKPRSPVEVYALMHDYFTRILAAAFLIGKHRAPAEGNPVYMRASVEWPEIFEEWLQTLNPADKAWYEARCKDIYFRPDGSL
eukprot:s2949_g13.t1